jgi:hypothetical protein
MDKKQQQQGRKELSKELLLFLCVWTFCVYGRTNFFVVVCWGVGVVLVSWQVGGGWLLAV